MTPEPHNQDSHHDEIFHRIANLEQAWARNEGWQDKVTDCLDRILKAIEGNGQPGLPIRVDRLEQTGRLIKWFGITIGSTTLVLVIRTLWSLL